MTGKHGSSNQEDKTRGSINTPSAKRAFLLTVQSQNQTDKRLIVQKQKHINVSILKAWVLSESVYSSIVANKVYSWLMRSPVMWPDKCSALAGHLKLLYRSTSPWHLTQFLWRADTTQRADAPTGRNSELASLSQMDKKKKKKKRVDCFHPYYLLRLRCLNTNAENMQLIFLHGPTNMYASTLIITTQSQ